MSAPVSVEDWQNPQSVKASQIDEMSASEFQYERRLIRLVNFQIWIARPDAASTNAELKVKRELTELWQITHGRELIRNLFRVVCFPLLSDQLLSAETPIIQPKKCRNWQDDEQY